MKKKGFTLIELIVVIAIIGVLAAILTPTLLGYVKKARKATANDAARTIFTYVQMATEGLNNAGIPGTTNPVALSELSGIAGDVGDCVGIEEFIASNEAFSKAITDTAVYGYIDVFFVEGVPRAIAWSKESRNNGIIGIYPASYIVDGVEPTWSNWDDMVKAEFNK